MQVAAICSRTEPEWRWRIMDYSGAILEESRETFATIAAAVAAGTRQLVAMNATDRSDLFTPPWRARMPRR